MHTVNCTTDHCLCVRLCALLQRFSAVIMRLRDPKTTALIFGSGKVRLVQYMGKRL